MQGAVHGSPEDMPLWVHPSRRAKRLSGDRKVPDPVYRPFREAAGIREKKGDSICLIPPVIIVWFFLQPSRRYGPGGSRQLVGCQLAFRMSIAGGRDDIKILCQKMKSMAVQSCSSWTL